MKLSIVVLSFALISMALLASCNSGSGASADLGSSSSSVGSSSQSSFLGVGITEAEFNALDRVSCEFYYTANPDSLAMCMTFEMLTDSARVFAGGLVRRLYMTCLGMKTLHYTRDFRGLVMLIPMPPVEPEQTFPT
jgi:predicted small secreted protein